MVAALLAFALVLELTLYAFAGRALVASTASPALMQVLWVGGCFLGLRVSFALLTRAVAWLYRDRERRGPDVGAWVWLRGVVWDIVCYVIVFAFAMPLGFLFRTRPRPAPTGEPVLLVHGLWCNGGMWLALRRRLEAAGHSCTVLSYAPPLASIEHFVPQLEAAIERLCRETGAARVRLVCHSMGGLVARAYLRKHGAARIAGVITLGSPHHGSGLAAWSFGRCVREMRLGSAWLADLAKEEPSSPPVPFVSVFSWQDNLVAPATSSMLRGARNLAVRGVGHVSMPWTPSIQALVLRLLEDPAARLPQAEEVTGTLTSERLASTAQRPSVPG
jgi:triacylglycerol lipase